MLIKFTLRMSWNCFDPTLSAATIKALSYLSRNENSLVWYCRHQRACLECTPQRASCREAKSSKVPALSSPSSTSWHGYRTNPGNRPEGNFNLTQSGSQAGGETVQTNDVGFAHCNPNGPYNDGTATPYGSRICHTLAVFFLHPICSLYCSAFNLPALRDCC